ncbi:MAG: 3-deoxy-D-manno-octulosonic acid transferase, partial [Elusimicrobia bacterium]|nr:3-deoxy-D-manno-octulosonic acid transferase [Elusimicrobiota bacterium]
WCAGSVRSGEETAKIVEAFDSLRPRFPNLRLVLAPRHVESPADGDLTARGIPFANLSGKASAPSSGPAQCLVIDQLGKLRAFYGASDAAFVGGTLVPVGGHNLLEPAAAGVPVLFGPHTGSIQAPAEALLKGGAARVKDSKELAAKLAAWIEDAGARKRTGELALKTAESFSGAAGRTASFLREALPEARL